MQDLEDIDAQISEHDSPQSADYVLKKIEEVMLNLTDLPDRGTYPKELPALVCHRRFCELGKFHSNLTSPLTIPKNHLQANCPPPLGDIGRQHHPPR